MSRFRRSRRRHSYTSKRRSARRPSRRYSAKSGRFRATRKGGFKRGGVLVGKSSAGSGKLFGMKTSTALLAAVAVGGGLLWMAQKRAAANAAAQAAAVAAAKTASSAPFPTSAQAMAPAPTPAAPVSNFLTQLLQPLVPNSPMAPARS